MKTGVQTINEITVERNRMERRLLAQHCDPGSTGHLQPGSSIILTISEVRVRFGG